MDIAIQKALDELAEIIPAGEDGFFYQGQELANKDCKDVPAFKGINTLHKLYAVLRQTWSAETAYKSCQSEWIPTDPSYGQCAITAMLVFDMFGGSIHRIRVAGGGTHYFNKIDGSYVDLTREQFDLYDIPIKYEPNEEMKREYCGIKDVSKKFWEIAIELFEKLGAEPNGVSTIWLHDDELIRECEEDNMHLINEQLCKVAEKFSVEPRRFLSHVLEYKLHWKYISGEIADIDNLGRL